MHPHFFCFIFKKSCGLQSCGLRLVLPLQYVVARIPGATRNPQPLLVFCFLCVFHLSVLVYIMYIYLYIVYILYNIINNKNKKKEPPYRVATYRTKTNTHLQKKNQKRNRVAGCVFGKYRPYNMLQAGLLAQPQPATRNLQCILLWKWRLLFFLKIIPEILDNRYCEIVYLQCRRR